MVMYNGSDAYLLTQVGMHKATGAGDDLFCVPGHLCQALHYSLR